MKKLNKVLGKKKLNTLSILLYEKSVSFKEGKSFFKNVVINSLSGIVWSIIIVLILLSIDYLTRSLVHFLGTFPKDSIFLKFYEFCVGINRTIGIKKIDYLSEVLSLGAGILGILLGLFYTVFVTIVSTKFSNVNSAISILLIRQKSLNRYFHLLATLTSLSILFQFILALGYIPTIVSFSLFTFFIIVALTSFVNYGRYFLVFFDISYLVNDLVKSNVDILLKISKKKENINLLQGGRSQIQQINRNLEDIRAIILESNNPQTSNTSLDSISNELISFSLFYFQKKQFIPFTGWHIQIQKLRPLDELKNYDLDLLRNTGVASIPETKDSNNYLEKKIIDIQFELFSAYKGKIPELTDIVLNHSKVTKESALQCDLDVLKHFFSNLEEFVLNKFETIQDSDILSRIQLISLFPTFMIQHIVGFNQSLSSFSLDLLQKFASDAHNDLDVQEQYQFPYFLREWLDNYKVKIEKEKALEGTRISPQFYTEFEVAKTVKNTLQNHIHDLTKYYIELINSITEKLAKEKHETVALALNLWSQETSKKLTYMSESIDKYLAQLNNMNFQSSSQKFTFEIKEKHRLQNFQLNKSVIKNVWRFNLFSDKIEDDSLSDLFGLTYNTLLESLLNDILSKTPNEKLISERLKTFQDCAFLYLEKLRQKIPVNEDVSIYIHETSVKLFPIIIDFFEINSIAFIVAKLNKLDFLEESTYDLFNVIELTPKLEIMFWKRILILYDHGNKAQFTMSSQSVYNEQYRTDKLGAYLVSHPLIKKEQIKSSGLMSFIENYETDIDDPYIKALIKSLDASRSGFSFFKPHEVFKEYYLRTRINLKSIEIKETDYGKDIRRYLETN